MDLMMFPKMLYSHDEGWTWLTRVHPSVPKTYLFYVAPMSLLPPAMLLYAAHAYGGAMFGNLSMAEAWRLAILFFLAELAMVAAMGAVIQRIGDMVEARPAYHDAFAFAAVAPTPLWLSSLALFVPDQAFNAIVMAVALAASGLLIYEGTNRVFRLADDSQSISLTGSILTAGLVAWAILMALVFAGWGWIIG